jgi:hypothetical protein
MAPSPGATDSLVHERRRLQRVLSTFAKHHPMGEATKFRVHDLQEFLEGEAMCRRL